MGGSPGRDLVEFLDSPPGGMVVSAAVFVLLLALLGAATGSTGSRVLAPPDLETSIERWQAEWGWGEAVDFEGMIREEE